MKYHPYESKSIRLPALFSILLLFLIGSDWPGFQDLIPLPAGIRHIFLMLGFFLLALLSSSKKIPRSYLLIFSAVTLWSATSIVNASNGLIPYLIGWLFTYLFTFIFLCGYSFKASDREILITMKIIVFTIFLMSIPSFILGLIQGGNIRDMPGGFRELGAFGLSMNIALISSITLFFLGEGKKYAYIAFFFIVCISMTILKKSIAEYMAILLFSMMFLFEGRNSRSSIIIIVVLMFPLIYAFLGSDIQANILENQEYFDRVGAEGHVRLGMYLASFNIAISNFPFGGGYGSFGSLASISFTYSPLYFEYGIDLIGANSPLDVDNGFHTLLDTFWPHIIGEAGFIGSILYALLYLFPIKIALSRRHLSNFHKGYAFFVTSVIAVLFLDGLALYTPEIPLFILLSQGFSAILCRRIRSA